MKSIREFLAGKLRRAEVGDRLSLEVDGPPDPALGALEGGLASEAGRIDFYAEGLRAGSAALPYTDIERVELSPATGGRRWVEVRTSTQTLRLACTDAGGLVTHAALRWIGHTRLRRAIAD